MLSNTGEFLDIFISGLFSLNLSRVDSVVLGWSAGNTGNGLKDIEGHGKAASAKLFPPNGDVRPWKMW